MFIATRVPEFSFVREYTNIYIRVVNTYIAE